MCYQTRQIRTVKDLELRYNVKLSNPSYRELFNQPQYHLNGFTHPNMLLIPQQKSQVITPGKWGIVPRSKLVEDIPSYYKESLRFGSGLNAKSEKLFSHYMYKQSAYTQRCVIPITGFFEPHSHNKKKYPIYIHRKDDQLFSLAGIYTIIGKSVTFSILTKAAQPFFANIHNEKKRQPVILNEKDEVKWLSNTLQQDAINAIVSNEFDVSQLEAYPVSKDLYKPHVNTNLKHIADEFHYSELEFKDFNLSA